MIQPETLTIGETTFTVGKVPATKMWDLSVFVANVTTGREIPAIGAMGSDLAGGLAVFKLIGGLPHADLLYIRGKLFEYVEFRNHLHAHPVTLAGLEESAFDAVGLSSVDIWKVFAKSFQANFTEYWTLLTSLFPGLEATLRSKLKESLAPSPQSSPPDIAA